MRSRSRQDGSGNSVSVPNLLLDGSGQDNGQNAPHSLAHERTGRKAVSGRDQDRGSLHADRGAESGSAELHSVEITPEMIEAGASIISEFEFGWASPQDFARRVYLAMQAQSYPKVAKKKKK